MADSVSNTLPRGVARGIAVPVSARTALRTETAGLHERVDRAFSYARLDDPAGYGRFLTAQAAAFLPCEAALDRAGAAALVPDWTARRRSALLVADLDALGLAPPAGDEDPTFATPAAVLGGVYVLEGSRLGGALLKRSVPAGLPTRFLSAGPSIAWRALISLLDERLTSAEDIAAAVDAARRVFDIFERSAIRYLERSDLGERD